MKRKVKKEEDIFGLVHSFLERHVDAKPHQLIGMALWPFHTHIYNKFDVSPRLAILSPVEETGKSTALKILLGMAWKPKLLIDPRSTIYHFSQSHTLLIDEVDNVRMDKDLRGILNAGHGRDGVVPRKIDGEMILFPVFGPVALAGIGSLPGPLLSRSVIIRMHRSYSKMRFSSITYAEELANIGIKIEQWAEQVKSKLVNLNLDPTMPPIVTKGRGAENWRVLISIANALGRGDIAREAAIQFAKEDAPTNRKLELLHDVRIVFDEAQAEVLPSHTLLARLFKLDNGLGEWSRLTLTILAHILSDFQIKNKPTRWSEYRRLERCYIRADFEEMWRRYLKPSKPSLKVVTKDKKDKEQ
jgi:hypothetical protein